MSSCLCLWCDGLAANKKLVPCRHESYISFQCQRWFLSPSDSPWVMLELEMWCVPTLGDTWPEVSTTLPEDSVWSIMTEVVLACWNLCLLRRVIVLWNDENYFSLLLISLDWTDGNHHQEDTRDIDNNPVLSICFQIVSLSISGIICSLSGDYWGLSRSYRQCISILSL